MRALLFILLFQAGTMLSSGQSWQQLNNFPVGLQSGYATFNLNGKAYLTGVEAGGLATKLWQYDATADSWISKAPLPGVPRYGMAAFTILDYAYVGTGEYNFQALTDFYRYDEFTDSWSPIAPIPVGRNRASAFTILDKGYVTCGLTGNTTVYNDLYEYDSATDTWSLRAPMPGPGRYLASSFSDNYTNGYLGLGYANSVWYDDFYKYNPASNTWTTIAAFPGTGRCGAASGSINVYGYLFCGNQGMTVYNDCFLYNMTFDFWQSIPDFAGGARSLMAAVADDNLNYIYCGLGSTSSGGAVFQDWWKIQIYVGLPEPDGANENFTFYPNPNNGAFTLLLQHEFTSSTLYIYNATGQQVSKQEIFPGFQIISQEGLSVGFYIMEIRNGQSLIGRKKWLVE